jgi:hypothetical protein
VADDLLARVADRLIERDRDTRPRWYGDPSMFARDCVAWPEGEGLTDYQDGILSDLIEHLRLAVRGPHGLGKSTICALAILWFALSRDLGAVDWKVLTTASSWRQLERFLWPEVHMWSKRLRWDVIGRPPFDPSELMLTSLRLEHGTAFAGASDDPALLEGAHAKAMLLVLDESKTIPASTWEAVEGAMAGQGEAFALAVSTPGSPSGVFYDIHSKRLGYEDWHTRHVSLDEAIAAKRISPVWAAARGRQWGETSSIFANRVLGEFASSDEDSVIPFQWVELANERWQVWRDSGVNAGPMTLVGVDVARSGPDSTVFAIRNGDVVTELRRYSREDTMKTTGRLVAVLQANPGAKSVIDVLNMGAALVDRLREQGFKPVAFNASAGTPRKDRSHELSFVNMRAAAWWWLREQLDPAFDPTIALPPDDLLIGDLSAPRFFLTSSGKLQIEPKDEIRKRLGRSPDSGDAVVMACFDAARSQGQAFLEHWKRQIEGRDSVPRPVREEQVMRAHLERVMQGRHNAARADEHRRVRICEHRWRTENGRARCVFCFTEREAV